MNITKSIKTFVIILTAISSMGCQFHKVDNSPIILDNICFRARIQSPYNHYEEKVVPFKLVPSCGYPAGVHINFYWDNLAILRGKVENMPALLMCGNGLGGDSLGVENGSAILEIADQGKGGDVSIWFGDWASKKIILGKDSSCMFSVGGHYVDRKGKDRSVEFLPSIVVANENGQIVLKPGKAPPTIKE